MTLTTWLRVPRPEGARWGAYGASRDHHFRHRLGDEVGGQRLSAGLFRQTHRECSRAFRGAWRYAVVPSIRNRNDDNTSGSHHYCHRLPFVNPQPPSRLALSKHAVN